MATPMAAGVVVGLLLLLLMLLVMLLKRELRPRAVNAIRRRGCWRRGQRNAAVTLAQEQRPREEFATETDWQRRLRKRRAAVRAIQRTPEYQAYEFLLIEGVTEPVPEPDPDQVFAISKRTWEASVQSWRARLRQITMAPDNTIEL